MASSAQNPSRPSPELFFEVARRWEETAALKAAWELDVFTAIGEGNRTPAALARRCGAAERGVRILCDALVVIGFLTKQQEQYGLTPDSARFLDRRSPACVGAALGFLTSPLLRAPFERLAEAVRSGGTAAGGEGALEPDNPMWVEFARSMAPMTRLVAERIGELLGAAEGRQWKVLDIAAGHGMYGITLARQNRNAEVTALDWANVLEVAQENARQAGVAERYRTVAGSALEVEFGEGYDVVLLTNFLHHFDAATCEKVLRKTHAALTGGGRAAVLEFVPNDDRVSPPAAAKFSLTMLATTPAGEAYTFAEYREMLRAAGFGAVALHEIAGAPQQVIVAGK